MDKQSQSKGGNSTVEKYGREHMRAIGARGGQTTAAKYGREHMASIGRNGAAGLYRRWQLVPFGTSQFILVNRTTGEVVVR